MKDAGMRIRVEEDLRRQFISVCRKNDVSAAQVIRGFMRNFVDRHGIDDQSYLFTQQENEKSND